MPGNTLTNQYLRDVMTSVFVVIVRKVVAQVSKEFRYSFCCGIMNSFICETEAVVMDNVENRVREEVDAVWGLVADQIRGPV